MTTRQKTSKTKASKPAADTGQAPAAVDSVGELPTSAGDETPVSTGAGMVDRIKKGAIKANALEEGSLDEAAIAADDDSYVAALLETIAEDERDKPGAALFAEACVAYGIDPTPGKTPIEVLHAHKSDRWRFQSGDPIEGVPDHVVFVTGGGIKVVHPRGDYPAGLDFERRLRRIFRTQLRDGSEAALPDNLTIPRTLVNGIVPKNGPHLPAVGFLRRRAQAAASGRRR